MISIAQAKQLPRHFGSGWISGVLSVFLGVLGLGAVLCLWFPSLLTTPELRAVYPMDLVRYLIQTVILGAFLLGLISVLLRPAKYLGIAGASLAVIAVVLGGAQVPVDGPVRRSNFLGLDWFLLNLLLLAVIFVPLERLFAQWREQEIFRDGWPTDLAHFFEVSGELIPRLHERHRA